MDVVQVLSIIAVVAVVLFVGSIVVTLLYLFAVSVVRGEGGAWWAGRRDLRRVRNREHDT